MRVVLFGGTDLTQRVAEALGDHLSGVVATPATLRISYAPDGLKNSRFVDMASWAAERGIPSCEWQGTDEAMDFVERLAPDWGLAAGWYHMLPKRLRDAFPLGCAGVHASMLPKLRGNAPLNWAILSGARETGVSLFHLTEGVDEGQLYGQEAIAIDDRTTIADLVDGSHDAAVRLVRAAIDHLAAGNVVLRIQTGEPSYGLVRRPEDSRIPWTSDAAWVDRLVRASGRPYDGAFTSLDEARVTVWAGLAHPRSDVHGNPGQLWSPDRTTVFVVCGTGLFEITDATDAQQADAMPRLRASSMRAFDARGS